MIDGQSWLAFLPRQVRNVSLSTTDSINAGSLSPLARVLWAIWRIAGRSKGSTPRPKAYVSTFPHSDSTRPWSQHQADLRSEQRERILCGNAADRFRIDLTELT